MVNLKKVTYDYYMNNCHSADIVINSEYKILPENVFCLVEYTDGSFLTVQYDIGILPYVREIPASTHIALSLNENVYIVDTGSRRIIRHYKSMTACKGFELYGTALIIICEAEIMIYDCNLLEITDRFNLPDMISEWEPSKAGNEIFFKLYDDNSLVTLKKVGKRFQIVKG